METTDSLQLNLKTDNQVTDNSNANKKRARRKIKTFTDAFFFKTTF